MIYTLVRVYVGILSIHVRSRSMLGKNAGDKNGMYGKRGARGKFTKEQADDIKVI